MTEGRLIKNKLRIVRQVGRGGMGYVYEVFHEGLRVTRALKQIVGDLQDNPEIERRFLHEAQMMARLEHPHIVRVFDIDQEPGFGTYLLMEFIRGRDLGELLRQQGRFSYPETLRIGIAVASALDCAHRAGLVHRDIKPANILIEDGTGRPVVTDFGIAKEIESASDESFTRTGSFVGTYRYSSREQIRSEKGVPIDGRADIYSLGVVLYEIFAGRKYLAGMPELKIASCVGYQDDWEPELDYPEPPPPLFEKLIRECLAPDREKRVRSASELVRRLEECRRLECIEVTSGSEAPGDVSYAAASTATTVTAPTPSQAGATQVATVVGEMTATTRDEPERPQTGTETRSQWVALLQGLRGAVDDQAGEFERLLKELIALDLPRDDFRQLDDMSQILHRVERAENEGQYQEAASNLQGLSDRIQRLNAEIERTVAAAIENRGRDLSNAWRELAANAGDLLPRERTPAFEAVLAPLGEHVAASNWEAARGVLRDAQAQLERARADVQTAARERSGGALRELGAAYQALRARSEEAAAASGVEPAAVERDVAAAIGQGAYVVALRHAADALAAVRDAAARLEQEERARAEVARREAEQARAAIDLGEARELAADSLRAAEAAQAEGEARALRGELRGAAEGFANAARLYAETAERTRVAAREQIESAAAALRDLVQRAATAPAEVVGDARRAALRLLDGELPRERRAAVTALEDAAAALARALDEVEPWRQARDAERAALAARDAASALGARGPDLATADRLLDDARAAFARRDFVAAREQLAAAAAAFEQVRSEVVARDESERLAAARAQIDDALGALDTTLAGELCADEIRRALRAREAAEEAERGGDRQSALTASGEALGALREAEQALFAGLGERVDTLVAESQTFVANAGELLAERARIEVERSVDAVQQALARREARAVAAALDQSWRLIGDLRVDLDERTRAAAADGLAEMRALLASPMVPAGGIDVDPDALAATVDALVGRERFADARRAVGGALESVRAAVEQERERRLAALAEARRAAEAARGAIDRAEASRLAAAELARADETAAQAERAERDGDLLAAARLQQAAADGARAVVALVRERQIAEVEAERARLEESLAAAQGAPEEVVGRLRDEARALLDATVAGDLGDAVRALRAKRDALDEAVAEGARLVAARERRDAAHAAEQRVAALGASRRQVKAAAGLLKEADAAFARKQWPAAADAYARAEAAYAALEAEIQAALEKERAAARAKAEAEARAAEERAARARAEAEERERAAEAQRLAEAAEAQRRAEADRVAEAKRQAEVEAAQRAAEARARARDADVAPDATVVADVVEPTRVEPAEATRLGIAVPEVPRRRGVPLAWIGGGAAALAAAAAAALWLSQREAVPPTEPARVARVERSAQEAPAPAKPVAPEPREPQAAKPAPQPATEDAQPETAKPEAAEPDPRAAQPEVAARPEPQAGQPEAVAQPAPAQEQVRVEEEPAQVANIPPPSPAAPPPVRIASFAPDAAEVAVKEGAKQAFRIELEGGAPDAKPKIAWRLDDQIVARDVDRFEYAPGYDAASDAPRTLEVVVGEGAEAARKAWKVEVANVNRKPKLTTSPRAGGKIEAKLGDTVELSADVDDPDGDRIAYAWTIDGKPAGDGPKLAVPVTGNRKVALTASDGEAEVSASWQIAAIKPKLEIGVTPNRIERLRFEKPQEFALSPPRDATDLEIEWSVDGKKVASGTRFTFTPDDPSLVRRTPVKVAVSARAPDGGTFEKSWDVVVEPPAPELAETTPPPGNLEVEPGSTQTFQLAARSPIGGQSFTYVFQVDGRQAARGSSPRFEFRVSDERPHRVVGYVQDNFDQVSRRSEWSITPSSGIVNRARSWLSEYEAAFNAKDARRIGELRGLAPDKVAELQRVLDDQQGLRVTFSDVRVDKIDDQRARLTYTRTDDFTDLRGEQVSRTGRVEQIVGVVNGRVTELETRRR